MGGGKGGTGARTGGCSQRDEECRLSENVQNGIFFFANHSKRKELETQTKQLQPSKWSARAAIFTHDPQNPPPLTLTLPSLHLACPIPPLLCVCAHNSFKRRKSRSCAVCSSQATIPATAAPTALPEWLRRYGEGRREVCGGLGVVGCLVAALWAQAAAYLRHYYIIIA